MRNYEAVREFHLAFHSPVSDIPIRLDPERKLARSSWIMEELSEYLKAGTLVDEADALIDLYYFIVGTFVEMGINPDPLFYIVHQANMAKLGTDGQPIFNEQGKVAKPRGWKSPEPLMMAEILRQGMRKHG